MAELPDPGAFGAAFEAFIRAMTAAAAHGESAVLRRLRDHLGRDPQELPTTGTDLPATEPSSTSAPR